MITDGPREETSVQVQEVCELQMMGSKVTRFVSRCTFTGAVKDTYSFLGWPKRYAVGGSALSCQGNLQAAALSCRNLQLVKSEAPGTNASFGQVGEQWRKLAAWRQTLDRAERSCTRRQTGVSRRELSGGISGRLFRSRVVGTYSFVHQMYR